MESDRRVYGVTYAVITTAMREGPDVVVTLRNA